MLDSLLGCFRTRLVVILYPVWVSLETSVLVFQGGYDLLESLVLRIDRVCACGCVVSLGTQILEFLCLSFLVVMKI